MVLETYQSMRDFDATPEPKGRKRKSAGDPVFVIQKHDATRLHYDLRLEVDGVLKSWAVTRGPSLVPGEKRLAVHVEDHPMDYGSFEGTIPAGQYGAGTVIVWDRGTWTPVFDAAKGFAKGHLEFELKGEKLTGRWHLIRMRSKPREKRENWLLIKGEDASARDESAPDILEERPESVKTGRLIEEVAGKPARKPRSRRSPPSPAATMPDFLPPMLATLVKATPGDDRWLHEIKFDGYRIQAHLMDGKVRLFTRSGRDWTGRFGEALARALAGLPAEQAILDGEVVVEVAGRSSDFSALQADLSEGRSDRMLYYVFDLLHLNGHDLTPLPLVERKRLLATLVAKAADPIRLSDHLDDRGEIVLRHACRMGLEGVVSKLRDSPYRAGRGQAWVKSKCSARQEFVIGGFVPSAASPRAIGSLVMGVFRGDKLHHVGRVGTGFSAAVAEGLMTRLKALETGESPFDPLLKGVEKRGVRYVRPELVAEVDFRAWTADGNLRHAAFRGLREDKEASEVTGEGRPSPAPEDAEATPTDPPPARRIKLTHPDRVYWPKEGITKAELADYYTAVWSWIAPHVIGRPLALLRCPDGIGGQQFFQKHEWKGMNAAILRVQDPAEPKDAPSLAIATLDGLIALVQSAALEIHPWGGTLKDWERPDRIVIDLDPGEGIAWADLVAAATDVRQRLEAVGLAAFAKTSGGKGLHVVAPLQPRADWPAVKTFCRDLAQAMASEDPSRYVATITKSKRRGKILVDYLRNQRGATAVAAYSTRARPGAQVSAPVTWDELAAGAGPADFTVRTMPVRLQSLRRDPWEGFAEAARSLPA
ncbi:DNA ligase D [Tabrizicola sp.]|uniref:DNA ligase D n=1 Tax=Tabrizicola sp. TaxID=2005166 RepID=UPI001A57A63B|nr:DNA ligase D [Tabrizicola sp.]MBL9074483.1 DNA ligase D [Tabrizicola sp.]